MLYKIIHYKTSNDVDVFAKWFDKQRDERAMARMLARIECMGDGNFGDCKALEAGVWELRIDVGQGYRLYYSIIEKAVILIICGGDKSTQDRDIARAIGYLAEYKRRKIK